MVTAKIAKIASKCSLENVRYKRFDALIPTSTNSKEFQMHRLWMIRIPQKIELWLKCHIFDYRSQFLDDQDPVIIDRFVLTNALRQQEHLIPNSGWRKNNIMTPKTKVSNFAFRNSILLKIIHLTSRTILRSHDKFVQAIPVALISSISSWRNFFLVRKFRSPRPPTPSFWMAS